MRVTPNMIVRPLATRKRPEALAMPVRSCCSRKSIVQPDESLSLSALQGAHCGVVGEILGAGTKSPVDHPRHAVLDRQTAHEGAHVALLVDRPIGHLADR